MSRPVSIQDQAILDAARRVFLRHGYRAATARVAREAGVSEGSLFKRFGTKRGLFLAAMRVESLAMPWHRRLEEEDGRGNVERLLLGAATEMMRRFRIIVPRMVMLRSSGVAAPGACHRRFEVPPPVYHARVLAGFFRAETRRGRLAVPAPEPLAHAFVGALLHYAFGETLFRYRPASATAYARLLVRTLLRAYGVTTRGRAQRGGGRR